ncbi:MAG: DUF2079 domain-containing protein, partial [Acidimicrobiia bacterium]|nr:DUF2079 domain-containing protein [Acidimicrobiia bacterium]
VPREVWVLALLIATWIVVFGRLVVLRQDRFGSFSLDMGIFDQATWLISRMGGLFMSIRGLHFFGHHFNLGLFLLAPFFWLGAGANFLNLVMVAAMALAAVPVYLLGRDKLASGWLGVGMAAAYLLHPSLQFMAWELFHPEPMALVGLFFAWWFARRELWVWYAASLVFAVCWKEDVALAALVIGLVLVVRRQWKVGLWTVGLSALYFFIANSWVIPQLSGAGQAFYNNLFGTLGNSPSQVLVTSARHPTEITRRLLANDAKSFYWKMTVPFAFVPLAAPLAVAVGVPQALIDVLSDVGFTRVITYHYAALPLAGLTLGAVEGAAVLAKTQFRRRILVGAILACSFAGTVLWGPSPIGHEYRKGYWPLWPDPSRQAKDAAVRAMAGKDHISATYDLAPHLAHRRFIYSYPNPFIVESWWGVNGQGGPDPNVVHWVVLNRALLDGSNGALFDRLVADGEFHIDSDRAGIVVARRVGPGHRFDPRSFGLGP